MSELIVKKLRSIAGDGSCCNAHTEQVCVDAADEIERLLEENKQLQKTFEHVSPVSAEGGAALAVIRWL